MFRTRVLVEGTGLTADEIHMIRGLIAGKSSTDIARELHITRGAVGQRLYRLSISMGTRTTVQTVVECLRRGWLNPRPIATEVSRAAVGTRT